MRKITLSKREKEKQLASQMIALYCRKHHHQEGLCDKCQKLEKYAHMRSDKCPFIETKTFCSNCRVHCYQAKMRGQIKKVMRYSGPRLIFTHPFLVISHIREERKERRRLEVDNEN